MRIGFVVNSIATEEPQYTTTRLAMTATRMGHEAWLMGVGDFAHRPDGTIAADARTTRRARTTSRWRRTSAASKPTTASRIASASTSSTSLMMRSDPADDSNERPWAVPSGVLFGQLAVAKGTLVVNDPASLANALNKTYFQHFPEAVRPRTLISRDPAEITEFMHELGQSGVLKPLQGSGGASVFLVSSDESPNLNQMIEAIARDGYVVAQEFLADAEQGDTRLFVMNGEPLRRGDTYAAFRRVNKGPTCDRTCTPAANRPPVKVTDTMLELVEDRATEADRGRDVPRRPRHRRRQADGDQRVQPGWAGELSKALRRRLHRNRHRGPRTQGRPPPATTGRTSTTPASPPCEWHDSRNSVRCAVSDVRPVPVS